SSSPCHQQYSSALGMEGIGTSRPSVPISNEAADLINKAWAPGTRKAYSSAWSLWSCWFVGRDLDPVSADINYVINFLAAQAGLGKSYRTINLYRSAISMHHTQINGKPVGEHPLLCRLLKGVKFSFPPLPKYSKLWDVNVVLNLFLSWQDNHELSLKSLSAKLTMLLCLVSIKRLSDVR
ncbi:hypothetical protein NDU88_010525, partial [Pleurodeles waltl]